MRTLDLDGLILRAVIKEIIQKIAHSDAIHMWDSEPVELYSYPEFGHVDGNYSSKPVTIDDWLDRVPFSSAFEKKRTRNKINEKFRQLSINPNFFLLKPPRVAVVLNPLLGKPGSYEINFVVK